MIKLKWKVSEAPVGRYRSFQKRGWPTATFASVDKMAAMLSCEDDYYPPNVKGGKHGEITVFVADHSPPVAGQPLFRWRRLKQRAKTLEEAKALALKALEANPTLLPPEVAP